MDEEVMSYCQLMERMLRAEQRVAELEEQLRREQDYHLSVDIGHMEMMTRGDAA